MLSIISAHPLPFIVAAILGLATAWWVWAGSADADTEHDEDEFYDDREVVMEEPVEAEPELEPEPEPESPPEPEPVVEEVPVAPVAVAAAASVAAAPKSEPKARREPPAPLTIAEIEDRPDIAPAMGDPDDLKRIKGIGPKLEDLCNSLGISRFDQIAAWRAKDVGAVDAQLGTFKGRITRDAWVAQAKLLANGKVTEHAKLFGS